MGGEERAGAHCGPPGLCKFRGACVLCVRLRSPVSVWSISSLLPVGGFSETQNTEEGTIFPP